MNNFQTILIACFLAIFAFAVLIFSGIIKVGDKSSTAIVGKVVIWGTFSSNEFSRVFDDMNIANRDLQVSYVKKDPDTYQQDLIEAFAHETGPDLFLISPDMLVKNKSFIYKIPYANYPKKTFTDVFIDGATIYTDTESIIAIPVVVDPMVMYYNKDIMTNQALATTPVYWSDLFDLAPILTKREDDGTLRQSMIALGRYDNINHAKDIIATLLMQNNNFLVEQDVTGYSAVLSGKQNNANNSLSEQALTFYAEFSNPNYKAYSWNRSMPSSLESFENGKTAFYLGRASELFTIQQSNPNLAFDVKEMLQTKDKTKRTYGDIYALAVNKKSKNIAGSVSVAGLLSSGDYAKQFSQAISLPPVSRALLSKKPTEPYLFTFFNSAIISRSWLDPDREKTNDVFNEMIDSILSNKSNISSSLTKANSKIDILLKK